VIGSNDPEQLRIALHEMATVVAHLVDAAGGTVRIDNFPSPSVMAGWVAVRPGNDGSLTLTYCRTRAEVDALTVDGARAREVDATKPH
jgi:hypothetical protein